jgi:hypothetical protein
LERKAENPTGIPVFAGLKGCAEVSRNARFLQKADLSLGHTEESSFKVGSNDSPPPDLRVTPSSRQSFGNIAGRGQSDATVCDSALRARFEREALVISALILRDHLF